MPSKLINQLYKYLNPYARLGVRKYSIIFPIITLVIFSVLSEFFAYGIVKDPDVVGLYAIFIPVALIIYLSFFFLSLR